MRHYFRINLAGQGYALFAGTPRQGFRPQPLDVEGPAVPRAYLRAQRRLDEAFEARQGSLTLVLQRTAAGAPPVVAYGARTGAQDEMGRSGLVFVHGLELDAGEGLYPCVAAVLAQLSAGGTRQLLQEVECLAVGKGISTVEGFLKRTAAAVEVALAERAGEAPPPVPPIAVIQHDCMGAAPVAWLTMAAVLAEAPPPWQAFDRSGKHGNAETHADPPRGPTVPASQLLLRTGIPRGINVTVPIAAEPESRPTDGHAQESTIVPPAEEPPASRGAEWAAFPRGWLSPPVALGLLGALFLAAALGYVLRGPGARPVEPSASNGVIDLAELQQKASVEAAAKAEEARKNRDEAERLYADAQEQVRTLKAKLGETAHEGKATVTERDQARRDYQTALNKVGELQKHLDKARADHAAARENENRERQKALKVQADKYDAERTSLLRDYDTQLGRLTRERDEKEGALACLMTHCEGLRADRQRAEADAQEANRDRLHARARLYNAHLRLAQAALVEGRIPAPQIANVRPLLEEVKPRAGEPDLCGPEWHLLWHLCDGHEPILDARYGQPVYGVACSRNGKHIAASSKGTLKVWDAVSRREAVRLPLPEQADEFYCVALSPDGERLAVGTYGAVKVWALRKGEALPDLEAPSRSVWSLAFSPDGRHLAAGCRFWDKQKNNYVGGDVLVWDTKAARPPVQLGSGRQVYCLAYSPDGTRLACGEEGPNARVSVFGLDGTRRSLPPRDAAVSALAFSPDGRRLAYGGMDGQIYLWDEKRAEEPRPLGWHGVRLRSIAFSADGRHLASAAEDGTVKLWQVDRDREVLSIPAYSGHLTSVAFSADGSWLVAGAWGRDGKTGSVLVWDVRPTPQR
jgi:hypothetical protein